MDPIEQQLKLRAWNKKTKELEPVLLICFVNRYVDVLPGRNLEGGEQEQWDFATIELMQFTGLKDKNGKEIYEGDVLEFADKWEWYRGPYGIKMMVAEGARLTELQEMYDAEPMERRVIEMPSCYEWILSSEIQTYWHVIGNIYENPELLNS